MELGGVTTVHLIDGPFITIGDHRQPFPESCKRLLAFLALKKGPLSRAFVAGSLWPTVRERRAAGNLRTTVWRLHEAGVGVIGADRWSLWLTSGTSVDVDAVKAWANRIVDREASPADYCHVDDRVRGLEILAGFYDDWAVVERERIRQRVLHALEALSRLLADEGRLADAAQAALAAVICEPLRESAQRALVETYLAEGNVIDARRAYIAYSRLVAKELGVQPSQDFASLVDSRIQPFAAFAVAPVRVANPPGIPPRRPRPSQDAETPGESIRTFRYRASSTP